MIVSRAVQGADGIAANVAGSELSPETVQSGSRRNQRDPATVHVDDMQTIRRLRQSALPMAVEYGRRDQPCSRKVRRARRWRT